MDYEDDGGELRRLDGEVQQDEDSYEAWEKLVRHTESLEGGINRNSSPQAIAAMREVYNRFLGKFPLFFGYWKKFADFEFAITGPEAADLVFERGVASVTNSVDLWLNFCSFKIDTTHDPEVIRELFERGASSVGLDFLSHVFWDKYLEFEERVEEPDRIFAILGRLIHIPTHQYARFFEKYRQLAQNKPLSQSIPSETLAQLRAELEMAAGGNPQSEQEIEQALRAKVDQHHLEIFHKTQAETTKRWPFEADIKRPYFHVTDLDEGQLTNWRKYLDFEESEGDYNRIAFLYERCLVAAAHYDEFWLRYARWMLGQYNKAEEVRHIFMRASCVFCPIARPKIRLLWATFEEMDGRTDVAELIYEAILIAMPNHVDTIKEWANCRRRQQGLTAAIELLQSQFEAAPDSYTKATIISEWATLRWLHGDPPDEVREIFKSNQTMCLDQLPFWETWLQFETRQPPARNDERIAQYTRCKSVVEDIRKRSQLVPDEVKHLAHLYMDYLLHQGGRESAKEYMTLDREVNK